MDVLTVAAQNYTSTFNGFITEFMGWGKSIFYLLATINIAWLSFGYAFDKQSIAESMPSFIRQFFAISLFYTLMVNPSWLFAILKTAQVMGNTLTHSAIDPSSLISNGIAMGNKIMAPVAKSSLLTMGFGLIIVAIVYVVVLFVFISIALDLALTLILTTALISVATFFLGFAALECTSHIARQTLDVILANCVKLLGIYLVVAAGNKTMSDVASSIPNKIENLDPYAWMVAVAVLFWLLAKNLPNQLARIVSGAFQATHGTEVGAMTISAIRNASLISRPLNAAGQGGIQAATLAGSVINNASGHMQKASMSSSLVSSLGTVMGGPMHHLGKAVMGNLGDHFKNISNKLAGGPGTHNKVSSIAERLYQQTEQMRSKNPASSSLGASMNADNHLSKEGRVPNES